MASLNRVLLIGNLTRDCEGRHTSGGTAVCELGLAVNDRVKKGNDWVDEVQFIDCTLFGAQAETAGKYLTKGSSVLIEGRPKLDTWEKDGKKNYKLRVVGERMQMLGGKPAARGKDRDASEEPVGRQESTPVTSDPDLPF
jgi:single-strand DNA-binding protein